MIETIIVIALCLIVAGVAAWYGCQLDSPNTRDALKIRYRDHKHSDDSDPYDYLWS